MRVDKTGDSAKLVPLTKLTLIDENYKEVFDLQEMIVNSSEPFFDEMGEELLLLRKEVVPRPEDVRDRIDILCLDRWGNAVILELKRGRDKFQLLQALSYASMIRAWVIDDFVREYSAHHQVSDGDARDAINEFLGAGIDTLNQNQRIALLAEQFDYEVLSTTEWLAEKYGVDIKCFKLGLSGDAGAHYLSVTRIYPTSDTMDHAWRRKAGGSTSSTATSTTTWSQVIEQIDNLAVREFASQESAKLPPKDANPKYWTLYYRFAGKRRVQVEVRKQFVYVWQWGRFKDDVGFWNERVGDGTDLQVVNEGASLRFYLRTQAQCESFVNALPALIGVVFSNEPIQPEEVADA